MGWFALMINGASLLMVLYANFVLLPALPLAQRSGQGNSDQYFNLIMFTQVPIVTALLGTILGLFVIVKLKQKTMHKLGKNWPALVSLLCGAAALVICFRLVGILY